MRTGLLILLAACLSSQGCATHITPPATVVDPAMVYLVDYGYHASLILPDPDSAASMSAENPSLVEFAFGQYDWYALNLDDWWRTPLVMFIPGEACLGRRDLTPAFPSATAPSTDVLGAQQVIPITVERSRAAALLHRLQVRWSGASAQALPNPAVGLTFVRDPDCYWIFHNCNAAVAAWLREAGCNVSGPVVRSDWTIDQ